MEDGKEEDSHKSKGGSLMATQHLWRRNRNGRSRLISQSLEIPRTYLPDSPTARHCNVVRHTSLSNTGWAHSAVGGQHRVGPREESHKVPRPEEPNWGQWLEMPCISNRGWLQWFCWTVYCDVLECNQCCTMHPTGQHQEAPRNGGDSLCVDLEQPGPDGNWPNVTRLLGLPIHATPTGIGPRMEVWVPTEFGGWWAGSPLYVGYNTFGLGNFYLSIDKCVCMVIGLVPSRCQAIIWTNNDIVIQRVYQSIDKQGKVLVKLYWNINFPQRNYCIKQLSVTIRWLIAKLQ